MVNHLKTTFDYIFRVVGKWKTNFSNYYRITILMLPLFLLQCRFDSIIQPTSAQPGEIIEIAITISDDLVPEPNAHKGLLCILIPEDWIYISGEYSGTVGSGLLELSASWADSAEKCYPAESFANGMRWIALLSDTGYTYEDPIQIDVSVQLKVGQKEGCFDLAYLVTKATEDLICTSWSPLSYPHRIGVPDSCKNVENFKAESAPEWNDLFNRTSGWTGADGIYSIPLSGNEYPGQSKEDKTLLLFSDTFIGEVDELGHRHNSVLVNNTYAILDGTLPVDENIDFFWHEQNGIPATLFVPNTPTSNSANWYWLMDGLVVGDSVFVFALRLKPGVNFPFALDAVNLLSFVIDPMTGIENYRQIDTPLYYKNENWEIVLGQAVMPMTYSSGNPNADGYIYVYGPRSGSQKKDMVVSRCLPEHISDFVKYEYWDGESWSADITECAPITSFISQEFSVSPIDDGSFIAVFQYNNQVAFRKGESPTGPFGIFQTIWDCPEVLEDVDIFVYNAKAHPHLSTSGDLLISYNVNTWDFWDHFTNAGIYRPRFITLPLESFGSGAHLLKPSFSLFQNYPNPFNLNTNIKYLVRRDSFIEIDIFNILGQRIRKLVAKKQAANMYTESWDGRNDAGIMVSSGLYFLQMRTEGLTESRKMILIK